MTKKPIIPVLTMLLTLVVLVHATVLLVQQETAWWLVMDVVCGGISLGMGAMWLFCRKRGGTKIVWKILLGLIIVQMLAAIVLQVVPIEKNRDQLIFWTFLSAIQCAVVNDMRAGQTNYVPKRISHGMVIFYKVIIGIAIALLIFCAGILIVYDEAIFYELMELLGISVLILHQATLSLRLNKAAKRRKRRSAARTRKISRI